MFELVSVLSPFVGCVYSRTYPVSSLSNPREAELAEQDEMRRAKETHLESPGHGVVRLGARLRHVDTC